MSAPSAKIPAKVYFTPTNDNHHVFGNLVKALSKGGVTPFSQYQTPRAEFFTFAKGDLDKNADVGYLNLFCGHHGHFEVIDHRAPNDRDHFEAIWPNKTDFALLVAALCEKLQERYPEKRDFIAACFAKADLEGCYANAQFKPSSVIDRPSEYRRYPMNEAFHST